MALSIKVMTFCDAVESSKWVKTFRRNLLPVYLWCRNPAVEDRVFIQKYYTLLGFEAT
jgi:hypothetical protein